MTLAALALWILGAMLVVVGLAGIVLPALPGALLVLGGLICAAWADGFERVGWPSIALMGVLAALSYGVDFAAGALGAMGAKAGGTAGGTNAGPPIGVVEANGPAVQPSITGVSSHQHKAQRALRIRPAQHPVACRGRMAGALIGNER
jgi:uncharacterized protein YqgC (DUF456 family)